MKRYYLYIECDGIVDASTNFYRVALGATKRDDRCLLALTALSVDRGHFFHIWDETTSDFYQKCVLSLGDAVTGMQCEHCMIPTTAQVLITHLLFGTPVQVPAHVEDNREHLLKELSLNYRVLKARK